MKRAILPILVVAILLILPAIPAMRSEETKSEDEGVCINIMTGDDDDGLNIDAVSTEKSDIAEFKTQITEFQTWIENVRPFEDLKITEEEKDEIKAHVNDLIESLNTILRSNDLDPINSEWLFNELFETEPGRSTIISVGVGYAFIPFYDYETFLGIMFRPIWLWYPPIFLGGGGYSGNLNINIFPPRIEYGDRLGSHVVRTTVFSGLYINIGELGYNAKLFGGAMIMLGQARVVMH